MMLIGSPRLSRNPRAACQPTPFTVDGGEDDQPGVQFRPPGQAPKISRILRDDDAIFLDAPRKQMMVGRAASTDMQWVHGVVPPCVIEPDRKLGRKTFVNEKPHAVSDQGLPPRRSTSGCVRA